MHLWEQIRPLFFMPNMHKCIHAQIACICKILDIYATADDWVACWVQNSHTSVYEIYFHVNDKNAYVYAHILYTYQNVNVH